MIKNKIISIQSRLVYGYVGTNIAELAIQLQGLDPISFPTVLLSAHSGHRPIHGQAISCALFKDLIKGIEEVGVLDSVHCILSGYMGADDIVEVSHNFISGIKKEFPQQLYICDPVIGDMGIGRFVEESTALQIINKLIPICDILTPNHFELEYILGQKFNTLEAMVDAIRSSILLKSKTVIVTSSMLNDSEEGMIDTVLVDREKVLRIQSKKIPIDTVGTGDLFTATLGAQLAKGLNIDDSLKNSTRYISVVLDYMFRNGYDEMNAACLLSSKLVE